MTDETKPDYEKEIKKAVQLEPNLDVIKPKGHSPPVFVKIDRYRELMDDIQKLRSYSLGMRDALDAMGELEKEFKTAMNITNMVLDKLNVLISSLDMKLFRKPGQAPDEDREIKPPEDIEKHVKNIYEQIERLKGELKSIS